MSEWNMAIQAAVVCAKLQRASPEIIAGIELLFRDAEHTEYRAPDLTDYCGERESGSGFTCDNPKGHAGAHSWEPYATCCGMNIYSPRTSGGFCGNCGKPLITRHAETVGGPCLCGAPAGMECNKVDCMSTTGPTHRVANSIRVNTAEGSLSERTSK